MPQKGVFSGAMALSKKTPDFPAFESFEIRIFPTPKKGKGHVGHFRGSSLIIHSKLAKNDPIWCNLMVSFSMWGWMTSSPEMNVLFQDKSNATNLGK